MTETQGGVDWELRTSEEMMVAAGASPALALAFRRHADGVRNMMQGAMVPMFVEMVDRALGGKIDGLRTDVQRLASESAARLGKLDRELMKLKRALAESKKDRTDLRNRIDLLSADRAEHDRLVARVAELEAWKAAQVNAQ